MAIHIHCLLPASVHNNELLLAGVSILIQLGKPESGRENMRIYAHMPGARAR